MATNNKISGNKFEKWVAEKLASEGWWVHQIHPAPDGSQPADLIAIKCNYSHLIDCKVLSSHSGKFPLRRIEENQWLGYERWIECGNDPLDYEFAILWADKVYCVPMQVLDCARICGDTSFDLKACWERWDYADNR